MIFYRGYMIFYRAYMIFYEGQMLQSNQSDYSICYKYDLSIHVHVPQSLYMYTGIAAITVNDHKVL